jgi:RNA polymerase sigma factor (sigma-70 family)
VYVTDEAELWRRARQEDGSAFAELFDLHHARIYRRALAMVGNVHEADDIAAAAFFELWRKRRSVPLLDGSIRPWLLVTTVNLSRNSRRSAARYRGLLRNLPRPEVIAGTVDADGSASHHRLAASLARLTPVDAALLVLTVLEDVPVAEAAQAVGMKPATARVRLHRARTRLRMELQDLTPDIQIATEGSTS